MADALEKRAHAAFVHVLDLDPPRREAWLENQHATDPALATRVRALLAAVDKSSGFLDTPVLAASSTVTVPGYEVIKPLGSGGMATVYEARQADPPRPVALKVMNRAFANTSAAQRFRFETEVLARLNHPAIASIFHAGTCADAHGQPLPFFAMEMVHGARSIIEYARQENLDLRRRIDLFIQVCDAVQHGHQLGVIHRDLKPANILVDAAGQPKVIDFGIARSIQQGAPDLTADSDTGRLLGTLNAMSPEQCAGSPDIDARTDVYSLGVVLYQLVASRPPHDLAHASIPEAVRIISYTTPPPPSRFNPLALGDLDAIITKAIDKDRSTRYAGAGSLADDLRRYLAHQPIQARPATALDQLRKFARRNPPLAAALAAILTLLVGGGAVASALAYSATRARDAALQRGKELEAVIAFQESQLSGIDLSAMGNTIREHTLASLARSPALDRSDAPATDPADVLAKVNFTTVAMRTLDQSILERSRTTIDSQFADQPLVRARLLRTLASTMHTLGLSEKAEPVVRDTLAIHQSTLGPDSDDTLATLHLLGNILNSLHRFDESAAVLSDLYARRKQARGEEDPATLSAALSLGGVYRLQGRHDEAEQIWSRTLEIQRRVLGDDNPSTLRTLNNMGVLCAVQGRFDEAEKYWRELLERRRRTLGPDHPDYRGSLTNLGLLLLDLGKLEEARPLIEESVASDRKHFGDDNPQTLISINNLAFLLQKTGELDAAEKILRDTLAVREARLGPDDTATLTAVGSLASVLFDRGDAAQAESLMRRALQGQQKSRGPDHPQTIDTAATLGQFILAQNRPEEALALFEESVARAAKTLPPTHYCNGHYLSLKGAALAALGQTDQARQTLLDAHKMLETSVGAAHPLTREAAKRLAEFYTALDKAHPDPQAAAQAAHWRAAAEAPPPAAANPPATPPSK